MRQLAFLLFCLLALSSYAQENTGIFSFSKDIGAPKRSYEIIQLECKGK